MPALSFKGAMTSGHGCHMPVNVIDGSNDTFVGNKPAARVGDSCNVHCDLCDEKRPCHQGSISQGSSKVFINNKPAARIGDSVSCSDAIATGHPTCQVG